MDTPSRYLFLLLCLIFFGCNKSADTDTTKQPDSTTTPAHSGQTAKSRNCIDSVIGVYYGNYVSHDDQYINGKKQTTVDRSGIDTLILSKDDSVTLRFTTTGGRLFSSTSVFTFDTTDIFYSPDHYTSLSLFPVMDSVMFNFNFFAGTIQDGEHIFSRFAGRK